MDVAGVVTPLHSFFEAEGIGPFGLVRALNGRFYGLTRDSLAGPTVFAFTPGSAPTTVHTFSDAVTPVDLFAASDGNVYGLTAGVTDGFGGTIFAIDPSGSYRTLLSIPPSVGSDMTSLVRGSDGRFYVTALGPAAPEVVGTVFTIDDAATVTTIHNFSEFDSGNPIGLMQRSDGVVFGTHTGGSITIVYSIDRTGNYREVHRFSLSEGEALGLDLIEASDGNLYGVTSSGVFRIDSSDTLTSLQTASGPPPVDLTLGADVRLYGVTEVGGLDDIGTIITIELAGTRTTIYEFSIGEGGHAHPFSVIQTRDGRFYGTTLGSFSAEKGTVFAMDAAGTRTTLHTFLVNLPFRDDGSPLGRLFEGADGSVYGTTYVQFCDPFLPSGLIFRISPGGLFTAPSGGYNLRAGVIQARNGKLYGTSVGSYNVCHPQFPSRGTIFTALAPGGTLHTFGDNENPAGELVEIDDGSLYGATVGGTAPVSGTIFQIDPATGAYSTRHSFTDGTAASGPLYQGTDGLLYGTTGNGGAFGRGTVFSLDVAGTLTTLHHFSGADGASPNAGVIQGTDGRLYGTTGNGGAFGYGTVFVLNAAGGLTTLHDFALSDGAEPVNGLIQANDGAFYGAAFSGGPKDGGVIFRVRLDTSPPDTYYELVSRNSGKCLDVYGASTDAAAVIQWFCHGGANQQWRLEPAGGGALHLIARHSGQALDVYGALLDDVTPVIQWPLHGGDNQVWTLEPASDGYVSIVARYSGKVLDVEYASTDDGARVIQYTPHGGANQQWLLRPVESSAASVTVSQR
jgi:uncharacterized repeat protein (TIGR03803 family)